MPEPIAPGTSRTWFITGAGRGLGREFTKAALEAGDQVAATARTPSAMDDLAAEYGSRLAVLALDVTDREGVLAAVDHAVARFDRLDVVVNNAGIASYGAVEEFTEADARAQLETNFFGALWVSQAVLPRLREQGSGHIVQISSIGGLAAFPTTGLYSASKWALEGMSEALAMEVAPFGIKLTIVEPGGYWTGLYDNMLQPAAHPAYTNMRSELARHWADNSVDSAPHLAAEALMKLVQSDDPPLRLILGSTVFDAALDITRQRIQAWQSWEEVSRAAEQAIPAPAS
ncbi:SDR family NAD(P)-dependent oxidoreductase [Phytoactinopolyspora mesophila]|uniref:SDR family NAD(P)-dependent oxidoreductase n=1 Tax=Phytoactinopolyspora mesophila TaxID=2650750 RepID=A0A7K3M3Q8_9ACTN|nr:SDR family NAD(P)-dependent oxidoreductase [Phytoactinopolyspora mesophila]NDL57953.1 SDR family NAD(P)-dependent oxidoreductase [Phytoactinopolyspora mesophila]